jgi:predicted peroxiredoxin
VAEEPVDHETAEACHEQEDGDQHGCHGSLEHVRESTVRTMDRSLVVKATAGQEDPERASQAFTVAAVAVASGVSVSLWLTGEAAWFAVPGRAEQFVLAQAAPLAELLSAVLAGGTVTVCSQCAARREITGDTVIDGVRIAGAPVFVQEALADHAQALVY